jgi:hypothetical protein
MNKFLFLILALIVVIACAIVYLLLNKAKTETVAPNLTTQLPIDLPPTSQTVSNEDEIMQVMISSASDFSDLSFSESTIVNNYALQVWSDENIGGEALLIYRAGTGWEIISFGGGAWDVENLVQQGVPIETAQELIDSRSY